MSVLALALALVAASPSPLKVALLLAAPPGVLVRDAIDELELALGELVLRTPEQLGLDAAELERCREAGSLSCAVRASRPLSTKSGDDFASFVLLGKVAPLSGTKVNVALLLVRSSDEDYRRVRSGTSVDESLEEHLFSQSIALDRDVDLAIPYEWRALMAELGRRLRASWRPPEVSAPRPLIGLELGHINGHLLVLTVDNPDLGVRVGDSIVSVGGEPVLDLDDVGRALERGDRVIEVQPWFTRPPVSPRHRLGVRAVSSIGVTEEFNGQDNTAARADSIGLVYDRRLVADFWLTAGLAYVRIDARYAADTDLFGVTGGFAYDRPIGRSFDAFGRLVIGGNFGEKRGEDFDLHSVTLASQLGVRLYAIELFVTFGAGPEPRVTLGGGLGVAYSFGEPAIATRQRF